MFTFSYYISMNILKNGKYLFFKKFIIYVFIDLILIFNDVIKKNIHTTSVF